MQEKQFDLGNSNSDFGITWQNSFCDKCHHDHLFYNGCPILLEALFDKTIPSQHIYDENDNPMCTSFLLDEDIDNKFSDHHKVD